jgi:hypothetical protein
VVCVDSGFEWLGNQCWFVLILCADGSSIVLVCVTFCVRVGLGGATFGLYLEDTLLSLAESRGCISCSSHNLVCSGLSH